MAKSLKEKMYKVEIRNEKGEVVKKVIEDKVNAIIHCAEFPEQWKKAGWKISMEEIK